VTPGWTTQSASAGFTDKTWFMREKSMQTPPYGALT
jgi:hypothetical protein